jgi:hypothetical protein
VLMKWYPGYMSAPHTYATDRLALVLSGTWWVNSGADFDPDNAIPVPAGGYVRRIARTPHYDGVKKDANEPAVIGLFGASCTQQCNHRTGNDFMGIAPIKLVLSKIANFEWLL